MRYVLVAVVIAISVAVVASQSWSQPADPPSTTSSTAEPIAGTAMTPKPGDATAVHDPFTPWPQVGSDGEQWTYEMLTAEEKAVADRGRVENDPVDWDRVNAGFAGASAARAQTAAASAAASTLNVGGDLATEGVMP